MRPGARSGYTDRRNRSGDGRSRLQLPMQDKDITPEGGCGCAKTRNGRDMLSADRQRPFRDKTCVSRQGPGGYRNGCCCIVKEMGTKPVKSSTAHAVQKRRSRLVAMMITPTATISARVGTRLTRKPPSGAASTPPITRPRAASRSDEPRLRMNTAEIDAVTR